MGELISGTHGDFSWIESQEPGLGLGDLVGGAPELLLGKCLVVASFDSGPFKLQPSETKKGWMEVGELAVVSPVRSLEFVPCGGFDEWYVFSGRPNLDPLEVFVNYASFGLSEPPPNGESWRALQKRFWRQLSRIGAESYLGDGGNIRFVTMNGVLFEKASQVMKRWH